MPDDFLEIVLGCFPVTLDVSVQILPSGSCKLENSFLHGLILSTTEVGFFI